MINALLSPHCSRIFIVVAAWLAAASSAQAADPVPPPGFALLFNGKDLSGWHGMPQDFDPYKLAAMSEDERSGLDRQMDG